MCGKLGLGRGGRDMAPPAAPSVCLLPRPRALNPPPMHLLGAPSMARARQCPHVPAGAHPFLCAHLGAAQTEARGWPAPHGTGASAITGACGHLVLVVHWHRGSMQPAGPQLVVLSQCPSKSGETTAMSWTWAPCAGLCPSCHSCLCMCSLETNKG